MCNRKKEETYCIKKLKKLTIRLRFCERAKCCEYKILTDKNRFLSTSYLKGLSHEIYGPVFWAVRMYLGLNVNRLWFLNFNDAPLILDNYFKF
jgi:hypothetical protein